jgi:hypothetical protein
LILPISARLTGERDDMNFKAVVFATILIGCGSDAHTVDDKIPQDGGESEDGSSPDLDSGVAQDGSVEADGSAPQDGSVEIDGSVDGGFPQNDGSVDQDGSVVGQPDAQVNPCKVGITKCGINNQVFRCEKDGWQAGLECELGCFDGICNVCEPGETRCDGLDVQVCNGQEWSLSSSCDYLCIEGGCVGQVCEPNEVDCGSGSKAQACNETGTEWSAASSCQGKCDAGAADCNNSPSDGCEISTKSSVNNCGGCGVQCSAPGASPYCLNGSCGFACLAGQVNCDGLAANGCEINTKSDVNNCGGCGNVCPSAGGNASCNNGACSLQCSGSNGDCDSKASNGCETKLDSIANCGGCGVVCDAGTEMCQAGACTKIACAAGKGNCDGSAANGCETNVTTITNCGACGVACGNYPNMATSCASSCQYACVAGFANKDGSLSNGCEVNTKTDINNCGSVGNVCSSAGGTASCSNGVCAIACSAGRSNCDGSVSNGCEINTTNNLSSCGSCGNVCADEENMATMCSLSTCVSTCETNYGNCDGNAINGCELPLANDINNCGACGNVCVGTGNSCNNGQCLYDVKQVYTGANFEHVIDMTSDATHIYFTSAWTKSTGPGTYTYQGKVSKVAKTGGAATALYEGAYLPSAIAVRNGYVFWNDVASATSPHKIFKISVNGGGAKLLAYDYSNAKTLFVDDTYVYWLSEEGHVNVPTVTSTTIYRTPVVGDAPISVFMTIPEAAIWMAKDSTTSLMHVATWGAKKVPNSGFDAYPNQGIYRINMASGAASRIVNNQNGITNISARSASVAWRTGVYEFAWYNGAAKSITLGSGTGLATDGTNVVSGYSAAIESVNISSNTSTRLAVATNVSFVNADDTHVFWADYLQVADAEYTAIRVVAR